MSKSVGNVIDPFDLVEKYGVDFVRYFLVSEVPFGNDGDYSDSQIAVRVNSNLANDLGNLAQRACRYDILWYCNCCNATDYINLF